MHTPSSVAFALALAAGLAAQRLPEIEPNNTVGLAQTLVAGTQVTANLAAAEQDWFTFTLAGAAEIHLRTSGNFSVNPSVDTGVTLFDSTGTTRLAWNDNANGTMSDCGVNLAAGTYTVMVVGKLSTTTGDYGLDFVVLPAAVIHAGEGAEPNHDPGLGGTPTPITLGDTIAGALSSPTDVDWYSFTLTGRSLVQAICYDDGSVPQLDNTLLQFFQETSPGAYAAVTGSSQLTTSHRAFNLTHPTTLAAGNYAIQVTAGTAAAGTAPFHYTKTGNYALRTRLIAMPGTNTIPEGAEPNNAPLTLSGNVPFFLPGDTLVGNCSGSNEEDWWMFVANGPTTFVAMVDSGSPLPITNEDLKLYDLAGAQTGSPLTTASSGGPGSHGRMIFTIPQAGIYYLAAYGGAFALTGDYVVYTGSCDPMIVPSSFQTQPPSTNACPGSNAVRPALGVGSTESPQLGSTFSVRLSNTLPNAVAVPFFGFSRTAANGGTVPLPYDLTPTETSQFNHCMIRVDPMITTLLLTDASGIGFIDFTIPAVLAVRGLPFYMQSMQLDAVTAVNPFGVSVSNDVRILVGDRGY
ncbi:MAG: PPC domain-containing protein [Planctomycetota bacterium]|nr:PPC domain-containing protein [Planctomycetota bacterium]